MSDRVVCEELAILQRNQRIAIDHYVRGTHLAPESGEGVCIGKL